MKIACLTLGLIGAIFSSGCMAFVIDEVDTEKKFSRQRDDPPPIFFAGPRTLPKVEILKTEQKNGWREIYCQFSFEGRERKKALTKEEKREQSLNPRLYEKFCLYLPENVKSDSEWWFLLPGSGENVSSEVMAEKIASMGYRAIRIQAGFRMINTRYANWAVEKYNVEGAIEPIRQHANDTTQQQIKDLMSVLDWLEKEYPAKEPLRFHVTGVSLGGITGLLFMGVDSRVETLCMIISAGKIGYILMDSFWGSFVPAVKGFKDMATSYGIGDDEIAYQEILNYIQDIEPTTYSHRINPRRVLMVNAGLDMFGVIDSVIPYSATKKTWEDLGKPKWIIMPCVGHLSAALALLPFWTNWCDPLGSWTGWLTADSFIDYVVEKHYVPMCLRRESGSMNHELRK